MDRRQKLEREIALLEKKLQKDHFGGIIDKNARRKDEIRLNKMKKELEKILKDTK